MISKNLSPIVAATCAYCLPDDVTDKSGRSSRQRLRLASVHSAAQSQTPGPYLPADRRDTSQMTLVREVILASIWLTSRFQISGSL